MSAVAQDDNDFSVGKIVEVESLDGGWSITYDDVEANARGQVSVPLYPSSPAKGQVIKMYPHDVSATLRGVVIDGVTVYYRTEEESVAWLAEQIAADEAVRQQNFLETRDVYAKRVAALPEPLQARFAYFSHANPDFDWKYGNYELFVCEEAVKIAVAFPSAEAIRVFAKDPFGNGAKIMLSSDHSAHTFQMAAFIARTLVDAPSELLDVPGALATIVGSAEYGQPRAQDNQ